MKPSTPALILGALATVLGLSAMQRGPSRGGSATSRVPTTYLMRSAQAIRGLNSTLQATVNELLARAYLAGIPVIVASGARTYEEQEAIYAQGRTAPGAIVTHARPGESWHNFGLAVDFAFIDPSVAGGMGKVIWPWPSDPAMWERLGVIGEALGLVWGGRFAQVDRPHFEYHPGMRLSDARAGMRPMEEPRRVA